MALMQELHDLTDSIGKLKYVLSIEKQKLDEINKEIAAIDNKKKLERAADLEYKRICE